MQTITYIVVAVVGLVAAWWALKVALGMFLPLERTARAYFNEVLKKMAINQVVPSSCTEECVNESVAFARTSGKFAGKGYDLRTETVKQLELHADMLRLWVRSNDAFDATYKARFKAMFERHGVPRLSQ